MHLHRRLGDADIVGDLFVEATRHDMEHDLTLAWAERVEALPERSQSPFTLPPGTIASEAGLDSVKQILITERLCEEPTLQSCMPARGYCAGGMSEPRSFPEAAMLNHTLVSIVDDNQPFRESLRKLVMLFGYTVESFPSAAEFLASRLVPETGCLVTDVHMPGMTGV